MDQAGRNQDCQDCRTGHLDVLRGEKNFAPFDAVGDEDAPPELAAGIAEAVVKATNSASPR